MSEPGIQSSRIRLLLWVLLIVGLPFAIVLQLWTADANYGAPVGDQAGGTLRARVVDQAGNPVPDVAVDLELWPLGGKPLVHQTQRTDALGEVAFEAPPLRGKYRLVTGGGEYQRVARERSFVDGKGREVELSTVELELRAGVQVQLGFKRREGAAVAGGSVHLVGRTLDGPLFGLIGRTVELEQEFEGDHCLLDGLPPFEGQVHIRLLDGTELDLHLEVPQGTASFSYQL